LAVTNITSVCGTVHSSNERKLVFVNTSVCGTVRSSNERKLVFVNIVYNQSANRTAHTATTEPQQPTYDVDNDRNTEEAGDVIVSANINMRQSVQHCECTVRS